MSIDRVFPQGVRLLLASAEKLGAKIPTELRKAMQKEMDTITRISEATFEGPTIARALTDAMSAGRDPITDPTVQEAVTRHAILEMGNYGTLDELARADLFDMVILHLDELVAAFKPVYSEAGENLAAAHATITAVGITNLDDPSIMRAGLEVNKANVTAREALDTIQAVKRALNTLMVSTGGMNASPIGRIIQWVDTADASAETLRHLGGGIDVHPWDAISNGYKLSLATPSEANDRAAHAYRMQEAAQAASELNRADRGRGITA